MGLKHSHSETLWCLVNATLEKATLRRKEEAGIKTRRPHTACIQVYGNVAMPGEWHPVKATLRHKEKAGMKTRWYGRHCISVYGQRPTKIGGNSHLRIWYPFYLRSFACASVSLLRWATRQASLHSYVCGRLGYGRGREDTPPQQGTARWRNP
jgi:hypothetical protein